MVELRRRYRLMGALAGLLSSSPPFFPLDLTNGKRDIVQNSFVRELNKIVYHKYPRTLAAAELAYR